MEVTAGRFELVLGEPRSVGLEELKGVGPAIAGRLRERGVTNQKELLLYVPRKYRPVYRYHPGPELARLEAPYIECFGVVTRVIPPRRNSRAPLEVHVSVDGEPFKLIWFNMGYPSFVKRFAPGKWMRLEGQVDHAQPIPTLAHPDVKTFKDEPDVRPQPTVSVEPVYPGIDGVPEPLFPKAIAQAAENLLPALMEVVPRPILARHDLPDIRSALRTIHLLDPFDDIDIFRAEVERARNRLVFEEFYTLQLKLAEKYVSERRAARAPRLTERELGREVVRCLPFPLTGDQSRAIATIADDLGRRAPMRRLLQGDVGSGKTVVAFMAAAIAIGSKHQVAMMAPTDILAKQHLRRAEEFLGGLPIRTALLAGSQTAAERRETIARLRAGEVDLVIGTHALFQADVGFASLGLVIVDEQHKFGVEQRDLLLQKGTDPHLLSMTATPIPRSLAHAVFGDLDLTVIREKPPGRKPVRTVLRTRARAPRVYDYVRTRIEESGEQAYFVYPMVDGGSTAAAAAAEAAGAEAGDADGDMPLIEAGVVGAGIVDTGIVDMGRRNVLQAAEELANGPFAGLRVAILHGRMDGESKDEVMQRFARGEIDVLCATTVVEVGMDVANATLMVIENPEFFGLSQLHQLRGRVGRGSQDSMCVLLAGFGLTPDAEERLTAFAATDDGFELAETDLRIRGPGQFLGLRQAGIAEFRFGDILRDGHLLAEARTDARRQLLGDASG